MKKLPRVILVRWDGGSGGDAFLAVHETVEEAIGSDQGVVTIGTYKLIAVRRMKNVAQQVK